MFEGCTALIGGCGSNISSGEITGVCAKTDGGRGDEGYFTVKNVPDEAVAEGEANGGRVSVDPSNNGNNFNTDQGTFKVNSANPNQICFYIDGDAALEKQSSKTHTVTATQEFSYEYKWVSSDNGRDWFDSDTQDYYPVKDSGVTVKAVFKTKTIKTVKIPS